MLQGFLSILTVALVIILRVKKLGLRESVTLESVQVWWILDSIPGLHAEAVILGTDIHTVFGPVQPSLTFTASENCEWF